MPLPAPLRFYLLGTFRVENDAGVVKLPTKSTAALLAYLVLYRNDWLERARLATLFWGSEHANELRRRRTNESTDTLARTSFRRALSTLRKLLDPDLILDSDDGKRITLNPALPVWVDAEEFADTLALPLYRDDLLADFEDDPDAPWLEGPRARYRELSIQACLHLAHDARTRGEWSSVVEFAQFALRRDAYQETAVQHLMVAYARQGETQAALKAYSELERVLSEDLGTAPAASTRALLRHVERRAAKPGAAQLTNLPTPLAPFLGRQAELAQLRALLESSRLVTLVGTGGSGKTRLAIQLAREALSTKHPSSGRDASSSEVHSQKRLPTLAKHLYDDGVWWVRLEELDKDTGSVAQSIAQVLSVRGDAGRPLLDTLTEQLRDSRMLLVLDNCEHLITDCARVSERILNACPHIKILATSRQPLHVAGETDFSVPPLPLPGERAKMSTVETSEAVQFFLHYARHARGDFKLGKENAPAVAQICRRLDGIPLALELAAARVKSLPANYIAEHLDERFQLFAAPQHTVPRHQTLRAVLDWSYDLLESEEQRVFEALGVFASRFTLDAALYVCRAGDVDDTRILKALEGLADKSLVVVEFDANDTVRYRLLETIREYAREKLAQVPEHLAETNARLEQYYLRFSSEHAKNYLAIEDEWNNIAAGMAIAHERQDWKPLLDYGQSVTDALFARGLYTDARRIIPWVITAADREEEQEQSLEAMYRWGRAYIEQSLYDEAREIMQRLLRLSELT